jgi:hypothetical protein
MVCYIMLYFVITMSHEIHLLCRVAVTVEDTRLVTCGVVPEVTFIEYKGLIHLVDRYKHYAHAHAHTHTHTHHG